MLLCIFSTLLLHVDSSLFLQLLPSGHELPYIGLLIFGILFNLFDDAKRGNNDGEN